MPKQVNLKVGIDDDLKDITLEIPDNAPRPWDGTDKLKHVGGRTTRIDGLAKTTGRAKYTFDVKLPGMLHAKYLRSPHPAAVVQTIDTSAAEKAPGVKAVVLAQDTLPMIMRYAGQEICAVAAKTPQQAADAVKLIKVIYKQRPFVVDADKAKEEASPKVFDTKTSDDNDENAKQPPTRGNIRGPKKGSKNNASEEQVDAAIAASAASVAGIYRTQVQTHSAMETHGVVAQWEDDEHLTIHASTQATFTVHDEVSQYFKLPKPNVRILTKYMGGGFGAKLSAGTYTMMAAKLARKAKAPVRLMLDRKEEHLCVGNRPNSVQDLKIGADKNGTITAMKLKMYGTAGTGTGAGTVGPMWGVYDSPFIYTEESDIFTNAGPGAPFRAPGHPPGIFALEQSIDELAYKLNIDPLDFRRMNTMNNPIRQAQYKLVLEKSDWAKRNPKPGADKGPIKRGIGLANSIWYYLYGKGFQVTAQVNNDGSVKFTNGAQDIGTGTYTVIAVIAAEELGLKPSDIHVVLGDTHLGFGPASGGSMTTPGLAPAIRNAAYLVKLKMREIAAPLLEVEEDKLEVADGKIFIKDNPQKSLTWQQVARKIPGDSFSVIGERVEDYRKVEPRTIAGIQIAEVAVDTETGIISVEKVTAIHDCGRPMNRLTIENQVNGGIIQGISYALFENRLLDRNTGIMVNPNLEYYKIAGSLDMPEIKVHVMDVNHGQNSAGAIGIGRTINDSDIGGHWQCHFPCPWCSLARDAVHAG